jgi:hypothetical protein
MIIPDVAFLYLRYTNDYYEKYPQSLIINLLIINKCRLNERFNGIFTALRRVIWL